MIFNVLKSAAFNNPFHMFSAQNSNANYTHICAKTVLKPAALLPHMCKVSGKELK